ncbi:helix-turn-helix domain-containing protein [Pseudomonas sp. O230]|uniref:helix-turn-helix domain-containing protein n=1 Tax=Pseudomonas sp. O230 TaxID=3159450 RepID=UPI00387B74BD
MLTLLFESRKNAKITQAQLAERLGKPQSFVSKYERGERKLDVIEFLEVCHQIETDPHVVIQHLSDFVRR